MKQKITLVITLFFLSLTTIKSSHAASLSSGNNDTSQKENFNTSNFGVSLFAAKKLQLIDQLFSETENKDYLFSEAGIFYSYFGGDITQNYGVNFSFGYQYDKIASYINLGYLNADFDFTISNTTESFSESSGFIGAGISYDIAKNLKAKLDYKSYSLSFKPSVSTTNESNDLNVNDVTLGIGYSF